MATRYPLMAGPPGTEGMMPRGRKGHYTDAPHTDPPASISEQRNIQREERKKLMSAYHFGNTH